MSREPCGCQCKAIDTVAVPSQGVAFDIEMDAYQPAFPLPILTLALITATLTLAHQKRRYAPPSLRWSTPVTQRLLVVSFRARRDSIRIITARKATKHESLDYEENVIP